jgi:hypothetical protein
VASPLKLDTPAKVVRACERAGADTRPTTNGGTLVLGPDGSVNVPSRWAHGRARENVLAAVRRTGIDLNPSKPRREPAQHLSAVPTVHEETTTVHPAPEAPAVTQADLDAALELIHQLAARLDDHDADQALLAARITALEDRPEPEREPTRFDATREARERIMAWFRQAPVGMWFSPTSVLANLGITEKAEKLQYSAQMTRLAEMGRLERLGERTSTQYRLPTGQE